MKGKKLAFIDLETTGTSPWNHEIIEIGCMLVKQNDDGTYATLEEFEVKVKPEHIETAEIGALRVNGYDEGAWLFAHSQKEALTLVSQKCDGCVMVAQNASFDYSFLAVAFGKYDVKDPFFYAKLDPIPMAFLRFRKDPEMDSFTLRKLCEKYGIKNEKAHTALADVRATFEVFKKIMGQ